MPTDVLRRLAAAALLVLAAAACGERAEPLGELEQPYPVTVQGAAEQPTVMTARPERIVALDPAGAELVLALGARDRLVGVPADMRRGNGARRVPRSAVEVVTRTLQVRVDEIVRLDPDLVVAAPGTDLLDLSEIQRETEAAVYIQPSSSIDDVVRATLELGFVIGEPVAARQLSSAIRAQVAQVEDLVASEPIVTTFVDTGFFITIPERSFLGDLIARSRGQSIAGAAPGIDPFPVGRLRRLDPQVYLVTSDSRVTLRALRTNRRTAGLTAVKEGRVVVLPSELVTRAGPRAGRALQRVAEALHPDAFG